MWRYSDFLALSEDFYPVFSEDVDRNRRDNWKSFIPHDPMRNLLERLILALERGHGSDRRSIWLTGAYGTGKTFASFVVKHLLEDPLDEIEGYFKKHQTLSPLWHRFSALRKNNRYQVVYRSSSGHITSSRRLMIEVQQAIRDRLREQGYATTSGDSIMDQLLKKLTDTSGVFSWEAAFNKYRGRFRSAATAAEVVERLRHGDAKMGEEVAAVLEEEGFALLDSATETKAWIREVIDRNNLQGIVFIWDEFTEFFANNVPVTPLLELAHITADVPFYFFLITHRALSQFTRVDDDTRKKLLDRFHNCHLEMTPVTAYELIANVIDMVPGQREEWEAKRDSLWDNVDRVAMHINVLGERVPKDELKMLVPIHPFTAYLLATISSLYSSSQRTLFQFLKKDEPGSFQWFITNHPKDDWYWLTPDYLWQYFFEESKIESIDTVSDVLTHYHTYEDGLATEEKRVLRVMLLLTALWRQTQGVQSLLKPSLSVIKRMFVGTDLFHRAGEVADRLCARGVMLAVPSANDCEYVLPTATLDHAKLREYRQKAEATLTFERTINPERSDEEFALRIRELLPLQGAARLRHPVQVVSARELKIRRERIMRGAERAYEVGVILVLAQDEEHLIQSEAIASEISKDHAGYCILISQVALGARRWNEWLDARARSWYYEEMRDATTKKYYDTKARNTVEEWVTAVRTGRIRAFFQGRQEELSGCDAVAEYLENIVAAVYPYGPERLSTVATLYTSAWGQTGAEIGLKVARTIQRPYKDVVDALRSQGVWEDAPLSRHADHPLAKMSAAVHSLFSSGDHVNLKQVWEALQQPPYGLMPSPIGVLLFGVLMRAYAHGYYYSDGVNALPLNPNKLAELIEQVMKGAKLSESYSIRKLSLDGERFCHMARDVFHIAAEDAAYPEEARNGIREAIRELGYPLWTLAYYVQTTSDPHDVQAMTRATSVLGGVLAYDRDELGDQELRDVVSAVHPVRRELSRLLSRDRMQEGVRQFWSLHAPQLPPLMAALHLGVPEIMARLRALLNEDVYLWREDRVQERLPELVRDLDLTDALNGLFGAVTRDLNDARAHFRAVWFKGKLPLTCFKEGQPAELAELVDYLYELVYRAGAGAKDNRAEDIRRYHAQLVSLFGQGAHVARLLVQKLTGEMLSDPEAAELYAGLPDLSDAPEDRVRREILDALSRQARQKKLADLRRQWQTLTGFDSPSRWSEEMRTPIQWMLEGDAYRNFIVRYNDLHQLSENEIDEMAAYLSDHAAELSVLRDRRYVLGRFVEVAAGEYAELVRQAGAEEALRDFVYRALRGDVHQWPLRSNEVQRAVRQWVVQNYRDTVYPRIVAAVEVMSADDVKRLVKNMVAEDALFGARLLAAMERNSGRH